MRIETSINNADILLSVLLRLCPQPAAIIVDFILNLSNRIGPRPVTLFSFKLWL